MSPRQMRILAAVPLCTTPDAGTWAAVRAARSRTEEDHVSAPTDAERITEACEQARRDRADDIDTQLVLDALLAAVEPAAGRLIAAEVKARHRMPNTRVTPAQWPDRNTT